MEDRDEVKNVLLSGALKMKSVMMIMAVIPPIFLALEFVLAAIIDPQSLAQLRSGSQGLLLFFVFALISLSSVTISPRLIYAAVLRKAAGNQGVSPELGGRIAVLMPALYATPSDLGLVLFFFTNIYATIPFHLLSLFYIWRFNLGIDSFLDRMAEDISASSNN